LDGADTVDSNFASVQRRAEFNLRALNGREPNGRELNGRTLNGSFANNCSRAEGGDSANNDSLADGWRSANSKDVKGCDVSNSSTALPKFLDTVIDSDPSGGGVNVGDGGNWDVGEDGDDGDDGGGEDSMRASALICAS